ncbi:MAG: hypothetical protein QE272_10990 [Nevskia sp.]|nr:hypothetical protein [Nevskia sp.]
MKIRSMSDLHIEFPSITTDRVPTIGEDIVVLAGDIGTGVMAIDAFTAGPVCTSSATSKYTGMVTPSSSGPER